MITSVFYISVIHAEGRGKVVPVCRVPEKTVLNCKCHHGIPCLTCPGHSLHASFWEEALFISMMETKWWHRYMNGFVIWLPGFLYLKDSSTIWTPYTLITSNPPWNWEQIVSYPSLMCWLHTHQTTPWDVMLVGRPPTHNQTVPVQAYYRPRGFQEVEAPRFWDIQHKKVVRMSALLTGCFYTPGNIPSTHFC